MLSKIKEHQKKYLENQFKITMPIETHHHSHHDDDSDQDQPVLINQKSLGPLDQENVYIDE